jgi:hypothetical protein
MNGKWIRPMNVDMICKLRVMGQSKQSFTFDTDEGDGYEVYAGYMKGEQYAPELKSYHFEEWIEQLQNLIEWLEKEKQKYAPVSGPTSASAHD